MKCTLIGCPQETIILPHSLYNRLHLVWTGIAQSMDSGPRNLKPIWEPTIIVSLVVPPGLLCILSGCHWLAQRWHRLGCIRVWCGIGLYNLNSLCDIIHGNGAPSNVVCNGPMPWQCSQGHLVCSIYWLCNIFFGDSCLHLSLCPKYWATLHRLAGA